MIKITNCFKFQKERYGNEIKSYITTNICECKLNSLIECRNRKTIEKMLDNEKELNWQMKKQLRELNFVLIFYAVVYTNKESKYSESLLSLTYETFIILIKNIIYLLIENNKRNRTIIFYTLIWSLWALKLSGK